MKILCVIVLYNQKLYNCLSYKSFIKANLYNKNLNLFIYDNSPVPQHNDNEFKDFNIYYHSDILNSGLSNAYNKAAEFANNNGIEWLLLLDQDTTITDNNFLDIFFTKSSQNKHISLFAPIVKTSTGEIMSPKKLRYRIPINSKVHEDYINNISNIGIINSGMFIKTEAFLQVGGYKKEVFLDYSDYQFIERYSTLYKSFYCLNTVLIQDFSNNINDKSTLINRYILFCKSLSHFEKKSIFDNINIFYIVFKRCISLIVRTKKIAPITILLKHFRFK